MLVVDDETPLRRMLERNPAAEGFEVTVAGDGGSALLATERSAPDGPPLIRTVRGAGFTLRARAAGFTPRA